MATCEDSIPLENLDFCPTDEVSAGVSEVGVFGAAITDFETIEKPEDLETATTLESLATVAAAHVFKLDRGFHKIYVNPDSGMVETAQVGEKGNLSFQNSLTGSLQGTSAKVAGYLRKYKNTPMIFIVREKNGDIKQIGSELSPAYLSETTGTSGSKPGDVKATTVKFMDTQNYPAPQYDGTVQEFPAPDPGV
jgi:hypothetical protein